MKFKSFIAAVLMAAMLLTLAACGKEPQKSKTSDVDTANEQSDSQDADKNSSGKKDTSGKVEADKSAGSADKNDAAAKNDSSDKKTSAGKDSSEGGNASLNENLPAESNTPAKDNTPAGGRTSVGENTQTDDESWKVEFEKSLFDNYGVRPEYYEDLGDGIYQVYVEKDGKIIPFVAVDSATGDYHG